jgi:hypothetical protein
VSAIVVPVLADKSRAAAVRREFPGGPPPGAELLFVEDAAPGDWSTLSDEERDAALASLTEDAPR